MSQYIDSVGVTNADIGLYRNGNTVVLGTNAIPITTESNPWTNSFYANGFTLTGLSLLDTTSLTIGGTNAFQLFTAYGVTNVDLSPYLLISGTNGLAAQSWVISQGYATASITTGLYSASNPAGYVTGSITNGLQSASTANTNNASVSVTNVTLASTTNTFAAGGVLSLSAISNAITYNLTTNGWTFGSPNALTNATGPGVSTANNVMTLSTNGWTFGSPNALTNATGPGISVANQTMTFSTNGWKFSPNYYDFTKITNALPQGFVISKANSLHDLQAATTIPFDFTVTGNETVNGNLTVNGYTYYNVVINNQTNIWTGTNYIQFTQYTTNYIYEVTIKEFATNVLSVVGGWVFNNSYLNGTNMSYMSTPHFYDTKGDSLVATGVWNWAGATWSNPPTNGWQFGTTGAVTNEVDPKFTSWLGSNTYVHSSSITNGFVYSSITNGLAATGDVNALIESTGSNLFYSVSNPTGFVTSSITNGLTFSTSGLASQSWVYVNSDTNGAANAVSNAVTQLGYVFASVTNALQSAGVANTNNASLSVTNVSLAPYQLQSEANTNNASVTVTNVNLSPYALSSSIVASSTYAAAFANIGVTNVSLAPYYLKTGGVISGTVSVVSTSTYAMTVEQDTSALFANGYVSITHGTGVAGIGAAPGLVMVRSRGTGASPSAVLSNDTIGFLAGSGYDGTIYKQTSSASIAFRANENWTTTNNGSIMLFQTTQIGTTNRQIVATLNDFGITAPRGFRQATGGYMTNEWMTSTDVQTLVNSLYGAIYYGATNYNLAFAPALQANFGSFLANVPVNAWTNTYSSLINGTYSSVGNRFLTNTTAAGTSLGSQPISHTLYCSGSTSVGQYYEALVLVSTNGATTNTIMTGPVYTIPTGNGGITTVFNPTNYIVPAVNGPYVLGVLRFAQKTSGPAYTFRIYGGDGYTTSISFPSGIVTPVNGTLNIETNGVSIGLANTLNFTGSLGASNNTVLGKVVIYSNGSTSVITNGQSDVTLYSSNPSPSASELVTKSYVDALKANSNTVISVSINGATNSVYAGLGGVINLGNIAVVTGSISYAVNAGTTNLTIGMPAYSSRIGVNSTAVRSADRRRVVLVDTNSTVDSELPLPATFNNATQVQSSIWILNQSGLSSTSVIELAAIAASNTTNEPNWSAAALTNLTVIHGASGNYQNVNLLTNAVSGQLWDFRARLVSGATGELSNVSLKLGVQ